MKVSEDLFQLIKSLDKQEKRYFKLQMNASASSLKKNLIDLFNAIDKMAVYDEPKIKAKFKDRPFVKQLHVAKNRLYNSILKNLNSYYAEQSTEGALYRMIHESEILYDKGLYAQGKKLLKKAKKQALEQEQFLYLLQILHLEVQFFGEQHNIEQLRKHSSEGYKVGLKIIERYRNFMELNMMRTKVAEYISRRNSGKIKEELENLFTPEEKELLSSEDKALSFIALTRQLVVNSVYTRLAGKNFESYDYRIRLVELLEDNQNKLRGTAKAYISALNNLLGIQTELEKYEEALVTLDKLETLKEGKRFKITEKRSLDILFRVAIGRLSIYVETNNFESAIENVDKTEYILEKYRDKMSIAYRLIFKYNIAFVFFCTQNYQQATSWLYNLLNEEKVDTREDIHSFSRILNLISYYELGNVQLLESVLKSTYRHFKNRESTYQYEDLLIKFIRKAVNIAGKEELKESFINLKEKMLKLLNDPDEAEGINNMKLISWIDSKIQNQPLANILKEKTISKI